ncbi:MAG: rod shape-determining protein MreC [Omnitrophica bacterium]|nr:rod shape-determining protein MreC [Candidatus Omnitrophota bacterium]
MQTYRIRKFPSKLFILIIVFIVIASSQKIRLTIKNFAFEILVKPFRVASGVKTYFTGVKNISEENLFLKQRIAMLSLELARTKTVTSENKRLKALLNFRKGLDYRAIAAKVIGRDSTDWRKTVIIDKGKNQGIKERMPCATANGLVGSVVEVGSDSSKVMLLTDPNSRVGVRLAPSREAGVLVGFPQGKCKVIYLSLDGDIREGEAVLTASFSAFFPQGLVVGRVTEVANEKANLYRYAFVRLTEDMNKIEEVICIDADK